MNLSWFIVDQTQLGVMLSKLLGAEKQKFHNSTRYCESIIKFAEIKQIAVQPHWYDQHLSQFWKHLLKYFRTGRPIQTDNSNGMGGDRTTLTLGLNEQEVYKNVSGVLLSVPKGFFKCPSNAPTQKIIGWEVFVQSQSEHFIPVQKQVSKRRANMHEIKKIRSLCFVNF